MASWNTPTIHSVGDIFSVSDNNILANNEIFLYQTPVANFFNSVSTSIASGTITQITLGGMTTSKYGFSTSSNNAVAPLAGTYMILGTIQGVGSTSSLATLIEVAGSQVAAGSAPLGSGGTTPNATTIQSINAGVAIGLYGFQTSGSPVSTIAAANTSYLCVAFVGSQ